MIMVFRLPTVSRDDTVVQRTIDEWKIDSFYERISQGSRYHNATMRVFGAFGVSRLQERLQCLYECLLSLLYGEDIYLDLEHVRPRLQSREEKGYLADANPGREVEIAT